MILFTVQEKIHEYREMKKSTLGAKRAKDITDTCSELLQIIFDLHDEEQKRLKNERKEAFDSGYNNGFDDSEMLYKQKMKEIKELLSKLNEVTE